MTLRPLVVSVSVIAMGIVTALTPCPVRGQAPVPVDFAQYAPECGVTIRSNQHRLEIVWPMEGEEQGHLVLDLRPGRWLVESLGVLPLAGEANPASMSDLEPVVFLTVGTRQAPAGRPPDMSVWNVFFDKPASRPYQTHRSRIELQSVSVRSTGRRAEIEVGHLDVGPFQGTLLFRCFAGARLLQFEAVVATQEDRRAFVYDLGLAGETPRGWQGIAWMDTRGQWQREAMASPLPDRALAVRHRALIAEGPGFALAVFPPPHQFFYPVDHTDNFNFVWAGRGHLGLTNRVGFGIRQEPVGKGAFIPWFNGPPGTRQRLGMFLLPIRGDAASALKETLRLTRHDRFAALPGYVTFTSHYHLAHTVDALQWREAGRDPFPVPEFVDAFKSMGVNAVHMGEFHGDGHQKDAGPVRLAELEMMFAECKRLSDERFLLIPGEEVNEFLGVTEPGKHAGHWMSLFPKPVYWMMRRKPGEPLAEERPGLGTLYRVGSREDMMALLRREHGLAWTAHPRIKASSWTPDIFRHEDFYLSDLWLGAAWKAMPADLSRERLGERGLDLLDDMANWGQRKYLPGEVDTFKIDHSHELYGHMNINYVQLDRLPRYEEGWQPLLDALRSGQFFTTTGEVLIRQFAVGGRTSGQALRLPDNGRAEVRAEVEWTFPLRFAEVISGDGSCVYRERVDLGDTTAFGRRTLTWCPDLRGRRWVRFEVWDVAVNGAYTQPVWIQ